MVQAFQTRNDAGQDALRVKTSPRNAPVADGGFYTAIPSANTDVAVAIPAGAKSLVVWFEDASAVMVDGRVAFAATATLIGSLAATDTKMGHHPKSVLEYAVGSTHTHVHVASATATSKALGYWTF